MTRFAFVAALIAAPLALASVPQKLTVQVGHSATLSMSSTISKVVIDDPTKVEVKKQGRKLTITALSKGTTDATIRTSDGETRVSIYVAADKYAVPY